MSRTVRALFTLVFLLLLLGLALPVGLREQQPVYWWDLGAPAAGLVLLAAAYAVAQLPQHQRSAATVAIVLLGLGAAVAPLGLLESDLVPQAESYGFWCVLAALVLLAGLGASQLAALEPSWDWPRHALPLLLGIWALLLWQILVQALEVPRVLLPAPSLIGSTLVAQWDILQDDFNITVLHSALVGFCLGCGGGFLLGLWIDRSPFLQRGLLPVCALASSVPLVGIAPIMVMWFGFDWQSKAAVVALMTFFPMLVSTFAGLAATGRMELDLMRSYAAGHGRTLLALRLPTALPFLFNGLKVASTLALIGAIVAEFFGSPTVGMGFRISTEAARMNMGLVWATIVVAALCGTLVYALLAWLERRTTFWHPSQR